MTKVPSLDQLAKMFAKEYAVVSLKFVREHLAHPKHHHAIANAKTLLKKAGFVRGKHVNLPEPNNPCGCTSTICYWNKAYFKGLAPDYYAMKEMANQKLASEPSHEAVTCADPEKLRLAQEACDRARLGIPKGVTFELPQASEEHALDDDFPVDPELCSELEEESCGDQPDDDLWRSEVDDALSDCFATVTVIMRHMLDETIKNYLRTLPVDHQRAFCSLFKSAHQDLRGVCTLTDEDGTVHTFQALPLPEETRRFYIALVNMFYQDDERWGPFILWLEEQSKPVDDSWKKLLQKPYSESLQRSYFFLTDLQALYEEKGEALLNTGLLPVHQALEVVRC
ncbi:hypothetical protein HCI50_00025 [Escherichia coli]|nr:hypothetical protein [Escherichia coli]